LPFSIANKQGRQILKLEGAVTIRQARELAAKLREALECGASIAVDTAALADIDTCVLQLLCSLHKTVPALSFDDSSEAFTAAVDRCGLRRELLGAREGL
jgi:anti-anti-sigma regulatory factor